MASLSCPAWLKGICDWVNNPNMACSDQSAGWTRACPGGVGALEGGVDIGAPAGTPVYALGNGPIVAMGLNNIDNKGVITQRVNVPGYGVNDVYIQHIDLKPGLSVGQYVSQGTLLGTVTDSSAMNWFQHTEVGFNAEWGGPWNGGNHPPGTSWVPDPRPMILALMKGGGGGPLGGFVGTGGTVSGPAPGPTSPTQCSTWDLPCMISEAIHTDTFQRIGIVGIGIILALVGVIVLFVGEGAKVVKKHPEVLAA